MTDYDSLRGVVGYDPFTGKFFWMIGLRAGEQAGGRTPHHTGYLTLTCQKKFYLLHKLAFALMGVAMPEEVDHINGDKTDNRWSNLRPSDRVKNKYNRAKFTTNKTGLKGVDFKNGKYRAQIRVDGKKVHLGMFETAEQAQKAYEDAATRVQGEFKHGR